MSSGLTFNRGFKKHFFSVGVHMTYASNDDFEIKSYLKQEAYLSKALIGYHYSSSKVDLNKGKSQIFSVCKIHRFSFEFDRFSIQFYDLF